jgi:mono/diheme cytochrome c family protein
MKRLLKTALLLPVLFSGNVLGSDDPMAPVSMDDVLTQGEDFYNKPVSCWVCHGENGEGRVGPSLLTGPSAATIWDQMRSNPQMGIIASELNPTDQDLVAVSLYIRKLAGMPVDEDLLNSMMMELTALKAVQVEEVVNLKTDRDLAVEKIESFETVLADWQRRAKRRLPWIPYCWVLRKHRWQLSHLSQRRHSRRPPAY